MIESIIDNDLYKLTMQQAVIQMYPWEKVTYKFYNRDDRKFPEGFAKKLIKEVSKMADLELSRSEAEFLTKTCGKFLSPAYIDFLAGYRFNPGEVGIKQDGGKLDIKIMGPWYRTILWEVPLMAMISQLYHDGAESWDLVNKAENGAKEKAKRLGDIKFADFGTRRRFSFIVQHEVVKQLEQAPGFVGTSNVYIAKLRNLKPIGTQAHEWFMFHGTKFGNKCANEISLEKWHEVYRGYLGIALTDTYTTDNFFEAFDTHHAKLYDGVRHDSGSPIPFAVRVIKHYEKLGIDPSTKTIVFSDGLNIDIVETIEAAGLNIRRSYGIGTNFSNDVGAKPLNIVIKLDTVWDENHKWWEGAVKLSDVPGKHTGDKDEIDLCKKELGL